MKLDKQEENLRYLHTAKRSIKWSILIETVSKFSTPLLYLLLAFLLVPEDFGIVTASFIIINFVQIIWDAGLSKSLVQTELPIIEMANPVFWFNVIISCLIYLLILIWRTDIAYFLNIQDLVEVLPVLGLIIILQAGCSVQNILLLRHFNFKSILIAKLSIHFVPFVVAIPLAFMGFRFWSLVYGHLIGSLISLIVFWILCPWRPNINIKWKYLLHLSYFGVWTLIESFSIWFFNWGDNLLVGRYFGADYLGAYTIGWSLVSMVFGFFVNPFLPILYATFSRINNDATLLWNVFKKSTGLIVFITLPLSVLFFTFSQYFALILVEEKWILVLSVITKISLLYGIFGLISFNAELYRAVGKPDLNAKLMIIFICMYSLGYLLIIPLGFDEFVVGRLILGLITIPVHIIVMKVVFQFDWLGFLKSYWWVLLGTLEMYLAILLAFYLFNSTLFLIKEWLQVMLTLLFALAIYLFNAWLFDRKFLLDINKYAYEAL